MGFNKNIEKSPAIFKALYNYKFSREQLNIYINKWMPVKYLFLTGIYSCTSIYLWNDANCPAYWVTKVYGNIFIYMTLQVLHLYI